MAIASICDRTQAFTWLTGVNWVESETLGEQVAVVVSLETVLTTGTRDLGNRKRQAQSS